MNRRILFIDDDLNHLATMCRNFDQHFAVYTADNVDTAVELLDRYTMAAAVTDYRMPGRSGLELLADLRSVSPATRRMLLTGYPDVPLAMDAVNEHGVSFLLTKPTPYPRLLDYLERAVAEFNASTGARGLVQAEGQMEQELDPLTGCLGRNAAERRLRSLQRTIRRAAISLVDIVDLRGIHEANGYAAGDHVLRTMAMLLRSFLRSPDDVLARWQEGTFLLVLTEMAASDLQQVLQHLQNRTQLLGHHGNAIPFTSGSSFVEDRTTTLQEQLLAAEESLLVNRMLQGSPCDRAFPNMVLQILDERSATTKRKAQRLKHLASELAAAVKLPNHERDRLLLLALIHDMGSIAIPEPVLQKIGPLTSSEWALVRRHSETGYRLAKAVPQFAGLAKEILHHHEHWDGSGYPYGLRHQGIPLLARCMAVLDAYDAMAHPRPGRAAMTSAESLAELRQQAGTQLDPHVVEAFVQMMQRRSDGGGMEFAGQEEPDGLGHSGLSRDLEAQDESGTTSDAAGQTCRAGEVTVDQ